MKNKYSFSIVWFGYFCAILLFSLTLWYEKKFGVISIDAILFHANQRLDGVPHRYFSSFIKRIFLAFTLACVLVLLHIKLCRKHERISVFSWLPVLLLLLSIVHFSFQANVLSYLRNTSTTSTFIEKNYSVPPVSGIIFPEKKRNVIILSLESMEDTFHTDSVFQDSLIPGLQKLQLENIHVKLHSGAGMEWTVGSMTGLFFGLPLKLPVEGNTYESSKKVFLPNASSLLEVFEANGYHVGFALGSDSNFSGIGNIFYNHLRQGFIYDKSFFETQKKISSPKGWGIKDKDLFRESKEILSDLSRKEPPFLFVLQTIDTHSKAIAYGDRPQPYGDDRDAFVAADFMVLEFLAWLKKQDFYQNTTVLIVGDHLYMNKYLGQVSLPKERTIYNVFLNSVKNNSTLDYRQATMLDIGPSLLEAIGVHLPNSRFGLGVSVFSDQPTLFEAYGQQILNEALSEKSLFYDGFF